MAGNTNAGQAQYTVLCGDSVSYAEKQNRINVIIDILCSLDIL